MTEKSSIHSPDEGGGHHLVAWLLFPLALFPLVALLTYDWRAVAALNMPPAATANWIGALGDTFAYWGYTLIGLAVWVVPVLCVVAGVCIVAGRRMRPGRRELWFAVFLAALACVIQVIGCHTPAVAELTARVNAASAGGAIGYVVMTKCLSPLLSDFGSSVLMVILMAVSLVAAVGAHNIVRLFQAIVRWATVRHEEKAAEAPPLAEADAEAAYRAAREAKEAAKRQRDEEKRLAREEKQRQKEERQRLKEEDRRLREERRALPEPRAAAVVKTSAERAVEQAAERETAEPTDKGPYLLPPVSLLSPVPQVSADPGDVGETSQRLIDTLKLFGVDATLTYTVQGPVVTKYALTLAPGTRYSVVTSLSDNLMGSLRAKSLRIEAPIPGEECVGIEVPNRAPVGISFREIIESRTWRENVQPSGGRPAKLQLPLLFGKDAAGHDLIADLATMPHMLVAGATGQGKSVCLNAIINGLLMTRTPEQLKFIMVDPKSVEFTSYASLPHLIVPVITDNRKVVFSLHWAVAEMEKRLKLFARAKCRNIMDFNNRKTITQTEMFDADTEAGSDMPRTVPYIVIIIDEVADLMATSGKEVVPDISRLTAKARAAGIHLILATQRPDAKVITGTIKANIPGRVAFKTATSVDSRTILDDTGAENLIGRGDMLFKTKEGALVRAQGAWISDPEIDRITSFIQEHAVQKFDDRFARKLDSIKEEEIDPFADSGDEGSAGTADGAATGATREQIKADESASDFKKAIECIINTNRASTSHFQRRIGWGYNHSAKIMDMLETAGVIGPQSGAGPRQIIMDQQQLVAILNGAAPGAAGETAEADETVTRQVEVAAPTEELTFEPDPLITTTEEQQ